MCVIYCSMIFSAVLMLMFAVVCFLVIHTNSKLEKENYQLRRDLDAVHTELLAIMRDYEDKNGVALVPATKKK